MSIALSLGRRDSSTNDSAPRLSGEQLVDDVSMHVGQTMVAALEDERQRFVVKAQEVQQCRLQVVNVHSVFDALKPSSSELPRVRPGFCLPRQASIREMGYFIRLRREHAGTTDVSVQQPFR